ncbi:MAG: hypothetical protein GY818_24060 [Planctomycetaceae bacterium]|nr:hypothetical protein [Planctomycetaceae bacterium]
MYKKCLPSINFQSITAVDPVAFRFESAGGTHASPGWGIAHARELLLASNK